MAFVAGGRDDSDYAATHDLPRLQRPGVRFVRGLGDRFQGDYLDQASSTFARMGAGVRTRRIDLSG